MVMEPKFCLIGKFFTSLSPPSIYKIEPKLRPRWNLSGDVAVSPLDKDLILFSFELETDMRKVLEDPWHLDGVTLVLKEWSSRVSVTDIDFSVAWFWVKVEGLPLSRYTMEESQRIGSRLSDKPIDKVYIRPLKRDFYVHAEIDLKRPLNPGFFIDKKRKRSFVQFKYKNLGGFCMRCGKIDHPLCREIPAERPLTRKFRTCVFGPWLRCTDPNSHQEVLVKFPEKISEKTEDEETVPYEQFFIKLKVQVVYANEHKWGDKTLNRSVSEAVHEHRFRFPCSYLATALESNDRSQACQILAQEIDENVPLVGLTFEDKVKIVERFLDYSKKNIKTWSDRRWVPVRICVKKTIRLSSVDFQTKLLVRKDEELCRTIDKKMSEMIRRRVENNEDIMSLPLWKTCIQHLLAQIGVDETETPFGLANGAIRARMEAFEYGVRLFNGQAPAEKASVLRLERVKVLGHDMDSLEPCVICQEGMFLGDEATRMPCSHLLHRVCIEEWLQRGNQCPLCRLRLPCQARNAYPTTQSLISTDTNA